MKDERVLRNKPGLLLQFSRNGKGGAVKNNANRLSYSASSMLDLPREREKKLQKTLQTYYE